MKVVETAKLKAGTLSRHDALQIYNGLDCALTVEILEEISGPNLSHVTPAQRLIYDFERGMQAPALEMMLRGWRVDLFTRDVAVAKLKAEKLKLQKLLDRLVLEIWTEGKSALSGTRKADFVPGLNPASVKQMKEFFYQRLRLPEQFAYPKGVKTLTTNREALEELENYLVARPFINIIFALKERNKKIQVLSSEVDPDLRMRTSYNVTGTETGRWSSSKNAFDGGTNLQNITEELRNVFIADPGKKLAYIDLSQAESRVLGFLIWHIFGDPGYLDACESGDLHTMVAKMVWEDLGWTGEPKEDKALAEQPFYLHFSYRDMAKRGGHGTNYYGKPRTMARHLKVRTELIEHFQQGYFSAFPGIPEYHRWCAQKLQIDQYIETPLGDGRHFFGRPGDDATLREAIAHSPQSMVGRLLNLALWRNWKFAPWIDRLGQVHDAIVIQYPEEREEEALTLSSSLMKIPLYSRGREFIIPSDVMVGWNWQKYDEQKNPDGIKKWAGSDNRTRQFDPLSAGLDRLIS